MASINPHHHALTPHRDAVRPKLPEGDLWVFGYGSLMWNPGFRFKEQQPARLFGYHRALCVWSQVHRGTPERPGMVLGLDRGGSCVGRGFRVPAELRDPVAEYLYAREMPTTIYQARLLPIRLGAQPRPVKALAFVVDPGHSQYAGRIPPERAAAIVARARGISGEGREYLTNTLTQLDLLGIRDPYLRRVVDRLAAPAQAVCPVSPA